MMGAGEGPAGGDCRLIERANCRSSLRTETPKLRNTTSKGP